MGWKQYLRQAQAAERRRDRAVARHYKELQKEQRRLAKQAEREAAADEVDEFESYLKAIVTVHVACGAEWKWNDLEGAVEPQPPMRGSAREDASARALNEYTPGLFARVFGGAKKHRADLHAAVVQARMADQGEFDDAMNAYKALHEYWRTTTRLAAGVQALQLSECREALRYSRAYDELEAFDAAVSLESVIDGAAVVCCTLRKSDVVPEEELKLTAGGKLTSKTMPMSRYWTLYQDFVCSSAIRIARETFAVLPVSRVIVNMEIIRLNPSNGHMEAQTVLAVHFIRDRLKTLRYDALDPSESMSNFPHRMKFKKGAGMGVVDRMSPDEQWVTT